jgi:type IV secretory pathway VirB6-like protein
MKLLLLILLIIIIVILFTIIIDIIEEYILINILGYKKYKYTKILSHGMRDNFMFHKTDEEALKHFTHYEFVEVIKPYKKVIKPYKK